MAGLILWKNQEMNRLKRDIDRLFSRLWEDFHMSHFPATTRATLFIDLSETKETLTIKAEIPGIDPEDLDVSITDDILTIKGEIKNDAIQDEENFYCMERCYGVFSRSLQLPCKVKLDDADATYKNGILYITLLKCKPEKSKEIRIKVR